MDLSELDMAKLEAFWQNKLAPAEHKAVQQRIASDPGFAQASLQFKATLAALNAAKRQGIMDYLKKVENTLPPPAAAKTKVFPLWGKIAAAAIFSLVLALLGWLWWNAQQPATKDTRAIAMTFFEPFPAFGMAKDGEGENLRLQAQRAYAAQDYKSAIPLLEGAFNESGDSSLLFYAGVAHLGDGEPKMAAQLLSPLQYAAIEEQEAVAWYLALAQLQLGDKAAAIQLLKEVKENSEGYAERAMELEEAIINQ